MRSFIITVAVISTALAAQLPSKSYLPQSGGGSFQQSSFQSQSLQGSQSLGGEGNRRPQQEIEKNAAILRLDQDASENGDYHYSYETSNGIRAEESGNPVQSRGAFSYKGDDGNTYSITYTSGEGGFRAEGAHLPIAPPTPEAILLALQQNAADEAKGIFDDGKYRADMHGGGQYDGKSGSSGSFSSSSSNSRFSSSSSSFNKQQAFNPNSGYQY